MDKNKELLYELNVKNFKNIVNKNDEHPKGSENGPIIFFQNKLNIIVGKNNTGKTNIFKAIIYSQNITDINNKYSKYIGDTNDLIPSIVDKNLENCVNLKNKPFNKEQYLNIDVYLKMNFTEIMKEKIHDINLKQTFKERNDWFISFGRSISLNKNSNKNELNYFKLSSESKSSEDLKQITALLSNQFKSEMNIKPNIILITNKKDESLKNDELEKYALTNQWGNDYNLVAFLKAFSSDYQDIVEKMNEYNAPITQESKNDSLEMIHRDDLRESITKNINDNLKELFKKKFDCLDFYPSVIISESNLIVKIKSFKNYVIDGFVINQQGTGIRNLLSLLLMLDKNKYDKENNFIYLVDELEDGLTINLQEKVVEYLYDFIQNYRNVTIIYTTHSPTLLPQDKIDEMANIIFTYRRQKVSEDIKELSGELLTLSCGSIKYVNKTGIYIDSNKKEFRNIIDLMKHYLELNEDIAKKIYGEIQKNEEN